MESFAQQLVRCSGPSLWLAQQMLKDVRPQDFASKPSVNGKTIDTNHPAFVYGHLSLYPAKLLQMLGQDTAHVAVPPAYDELFASGKPCQHDPEGKIYPPMNEITGHFTRSYTALVEQLKTLPDTAFSAPNTHPRLKDMFPDMSGMSMFMLTSHIMLHLGQISAWRRFHGLGSAM
jgi:hypothetical protein